MKRNVSKLLLLILSVALFSASAYSQIGFGKLSGKINDADTNEPLVSVNIYLVNTKLGAVSDIEGEYFILNIPPGTYDVRISHVGYGPKTFKEVRIVAGITYELNAALSTDLTLPEIVVEGRKFFESKATNITKVIDSKQIEQLPVRGIENLASLQAGVVISEGSGGTSGNAVINVRGGRGGEVLYIVDGVPQNDAYTGLNYSQVSNSAIEQLSFQIGGYEAKYGQAQSGIINVTSKSGGSKYSIFGDVLSSSFTDDHGYNLYTLNLSGPILPKNSDHTFFLSGERGWFKDDNPRATGLEIPTIGMSSSSLPEMQSSLWRYTAKTSHSIGKFTANLGANINERHFRGYIHSYSKNNAKHNPRVERSNYSFSGKLAQNVSARTFWNLNVGYKIYKNEQGDGIWFDDLEAYGDSLRNWNELGVKLPSWGGWVPFDRNQIFALNGRVNNAYYLTNNQSINGVFDFVSQQGNHLLQLGGGLTYHILRYYYIAPRALSASTIRILPEAERYRRLQPTVIGFDITGKNKSSKGDEFEPKQPIISYAYIQDRIELADMVLNLGLRFDYFDMQTDILKNPNLPFGGGTDPDGYDAGDFKTKKAEYYFSPRIGLAFPVTTNTTFYTMYGKFIQQPSLDQLYTTVFDLNFLITDDNWSLNTGQVESEITTQYDIGFKHMLSENAALEVAAFYKNTEGLINTATTFFARQEGGQMLRYITPTNTDFGTIKGLQFSIDVRKLWYFSVRADYTYAIAEGTGSSTSSSFTAAFRNTAGEVPKVIAPLNFDQRHTGVINLNFNIPKGDLGFFEMINANSLFTFNSGRPYTPLESQNILQGWTNYGDTRGYVNSANGPGYFRIDLKVEKPFMFSNLIITPYIWVENLLDADNPVIVYQSSGDPYTTGWLSTLEGQKAIISAPDPTEYESDYRARERDPFNFGIPRQIKLGLKVNFTNLQF